MSSSDDDWIKILDPDSGSNYYYNNTTGESSWDPPAGFLFGDEEKEEDPSIFLTQFETTREVGDEDALTASRIIWPHEEGIVRLLRLDVFEADSPIRHRLEFFEFFSF